MNVLFLTIGDFNDLKAGSVHIDVVKKIAEHGHKVYVACANPASCGDDVTIEQAEGISILRIKTRPVKKNTNLIEKGLATVLLEKTYINAIKKVLCDVRFDLVLYHTPPVTFEKVVRFVKRRDGASSYLLLKDIFPQNAVDLGMMSKKGIKGIVYRYFRKKERNLYAVSDYIGCMSPANVSFIVNNNPDYPPEKVEVAPNSVELKKLDYDEAQTRAERFYIRKKYGLPTDLPIIIYGGNLGKPQGIDYLIKCLDANKLRKDCLFLIVGNGSEFFKLQSWINEAGLYAKNDTLSVKLMKSIPKEDYDALVRSCDVGMIFLDHNFTIPNYPSRLLSYLQSKIPVICATDTNTDIGSIAEDNGYGYWCESVNPADFTMMVDKMLQSDMHAMGQLGYDFLCKNYLAENTYNAIFKHFK